jgi:ribonuclease P/MRP protein subunit POP5
MVFSMAKIKPVLPSLREKKRYLVFEIISKKPIKEFSAISKAIWKAVLDLSGVLGASKAGIWLLGDKFNKDTQKGIIKVNHKNADLLKAALCTIKQISGTDVIVRSVGVSGILKKTERYLH